MFARRVLLVFVAIGVMLLLPISASGQRQCTPVTGLMNADFVGYWFGTATLNIGGETYSATAETHNTGVSKGGAGSSDNNWIGTEETLLTFDDGSTLVLSTMFRTVHMTDISRFYVNETTEITGGSGMFEGATGKLTSHGPFAFMHWEGEYHGNICGL